MPAPSRPQATRTPASPRRTGLPSWRGPSEGASYGPRAYGRDVDRYMDVLGERARFSAGVLGGHEGLAQPLVVEQVLGFGRVTEQHVRNLVKKRAVRQERDRERRPEDHLLE